MRDWIFARWEHVLCGLLLFARIADLGTTWLVTPRLLLEGNPIVRRLRWPFGLLTLLVCLLPYYHTGLAFSALVTFLLVSASNARGIWFVRAIGEERYLQLLREAAAGSSLGSALVGMLLPAGFFLLIGNLFLLVSQGWGDWAAWGALGLFLFAAVTSIYGSLSMHRLFRATKP